MNEQTWSKLKPTEAGFYWLRIVVAPDAGDHLVSMKKEIWPDGHAYLLCTHVSGCTIDSGWTIEAKAEEPSDEDELEADSLWCGPLKPPK